MLPDTHASLWWVRDDPRLSRRAREIFDDTADELLFSVASAWEIAIKAQIGKLRVSGDLGPYLSTQLHDNAIKVPPIYLSHAVRFGSLPTHHHDPFDRLLVAQAAVEELPLLSSDPAISRYAVEIVW